ncbi:MAG: fibronectin type III domain-containing protein, partial [Candidatus Dormiibacterota bacterium]
LAAAWMPVPLAVAAGPAPVSVTPYSGFNPLLGRAPYLTDLTQTSVVVNWAETKFLSPGEDTSLPQYASIPGFVKWGPAGSACDAHSAPVPSSLPTLVPASDTPASVVGREYQVFNGDKTVATNEYQSSVRLTGLAPGTGYCYRVYGYDYVGITKTPVDLLGSNHSPSFTTLAPVSSSSTAPVTFDVLGDTGEACVTVLPCTGPANNLINPDQAAIDKLIGQSGAQFALLAGDVGYPSGLQTRYGDLQQTGQATVNTPIPDANPDSEEVSNMFGPNYWPQTGGLPTYYTDGNHGLDVTSLRVWPESATAAASNGVFGDVAYPASTADGTPAVSYPAMWYAISVGNVRIYMLTAAWADGNTGTATGGACGSLCSAYQVDANLHWQQSSAEYQWLKQDLAAHPGGIKLAVWHYPLRSYSSSQVSDPFLQNSSANSSAQAAQNSLEALLAENGVYIAFNGHAHNYQRIDPAGPGQVISYVTGGGGGVLGSVTCSNLTGLSSAYALGWDPAASIGSSCGVANGVATSVPVPTSMAQVYNFLKVTVVGSSVTVTPINAAGQQFDVQTYNFGTAAPQPPGQPVGTAEPSAVSLTWPFPANVDTSATSDYVVTPYANGVQQTSIDIHSPVPAYTVTGLTNGVPYTFTVTAENANGTSSPSPPSAPVTPGAPAPATYTPVTPYRICDTRAGNPSNLTGVNAQCNGETLGSGSQIQVQVTGTNPSGTTSGGVPVGATSVVLNVTATNTTTAGWAAAWPAGGALPLSSSLNWLAGQTVANLVTVAVNSQGQISLANGVGQADLIVDVEGWLDSTDVSGGPYVPLQPYRVCDTRPGNPSNLTGVNSECDGRTLGPGGQIPVQVGGTNPSGTTSGGVPSNATAVVLTVTATDTTQASWVAAWPAGQAQPFASNLNFGAGQTVANSVVVGLSSKGMIDVYNLAGNTDIVVDVSGYYSAGSPPPSGATYFTPMVPFRICDTRPAATSQPPDYCAGDTLQGGSAFAFQFAGVGGIPASARAVVLNVTVTDTTAPGFLTVFPYQTARPLVSSLNWVPGETVASGVIATLGTNGWVDFYIPQGQADLVVDVVGWQQ